MNKDKSHYKNRNKLTAVQIAAIASMIVFVGTMLALVGVAIYNMRNNPINGIVNNLSESKDMTSAAVSAIETVTSNAISSTTLIITVAGVFMTGVSVFAALIVYITYAKLNDIDKKISEVDTRIGVETYMRHLSSGIRYWDHKLYSYALREFEQVLTSKDDACCLSANYCIGLLHSDRFMDNNNPIDFKKAEEHLLSAIHFAPDIDPIIHNDSYASLGCLYGLWVEKNFYGAFRDNYLNKSEEFIKKAMDTFQLAVHYKNLAITYALKNNVDKAIEYIEKGIQRDADEKGITDETKRNKNAKEFFNKLFTEEEKQLIPYKEIKNYFDNKNHLSV